MKSTQDLKDEAAQYIRYEKDKTTKIATLTICRPDKLNATTVGMRLNFAEWVFKSNIDDDVKVLVIRGEGQHLGSGGDLPEHGDEIANPGEDASLLHELEINDADVRYPPPGSFRFLHGLTDFYVKSRAGNRCLQEFKKISIVEAKGYCYGWHFYQCADADLIVSSDDALFGHPAFRYVGWAPRLWQWIETMGLRRFQEMLFTGRPFTGQEMHKIGFVNSVVPREDLEKETMKYAMACAQSRPNDTVAVQKTFLEIYKQYRGEYMGSVLTGMMEGMLPIIKDDKPQESFGGVIEEGLAQGVKKIEMNYPPEWRMSMSGRKKP